MAMEEEVRWPGEGLLTEAWVDAFASKLERTSRELPPQQLRCVLPVSFIDSLIICASKLLHHEPNCLQISVDETCSVVLVGDLHGQLHDLLHLLQLAGPPSSSRIFIFNGDYVDRGAWGLETFLLLLAWKVFLPHRVFLLRGNHETRFCTMTYGFEQEVMVKYGEHGQHVYRKCLGCFEGLPLAAVIAEKVFMAHGGLFRRHDTSEKKDKRKGRAKKLTERADRSILQLGTINDLLVVRRNILDPPEKGNNVLVGDVLWSDPAPKPGLHPNTARGIGLLWGPDCTEEFLQKHRLKLIVRSHEGPDARIKRPDMMDMSKGYTIDHNVDSGKLITLFSAPDYPQFQATKCRYNNKGAYIILDAPDFSSPTFYTFVATLPRPKVTAYYDFVNVADSDDEIDVGGNSDGSSGWSR
ncbi:hypothetical protein KP509_25G051200 [Ceratopteris richardii]|uniref:Serine/threonine-protein phosphatase n=1 Tax=Ceratopteris richardii TaxID=49495 RepID=A0A8T2RSZ7_CERRI|nr:hypothetical protein KP509_25G051200 [Ceratopteris richardii]KAH7298618.1 hypothetical protein KP509_25G051200 [Ceratopteris richardii]